MQTHTLYTLLTVGFGLGLLHALDADHIMAVSALANKRRSPRRAHEVARFCVRWALGHGGVLLALSVVLIFAGLKLPDSVAVVAERAVGVLLIVIGLVIARSVYTQSIRLNVHTHNDVTHMHIAEDDSAEHDHTPILVGMTHGLAGSAPILAIIPAINADVSSPWFALTYVALFSFGVIVAMMIFGLALARVQQWLVNAGRRVFNIGRCLIAATSVICGSYWLFAAH